MSDEVLWSNGIDSIEIGTLTGEIRVFENGDLVDVVVCGSSVIEMAIKQLQECKCQQIRQVSLEG